MVSVQRWIFQEDCARERFVSTEIAVGNYQCMGQCFRGRRCKAGQPEF